MINSNHDDLCDPPIDPKTPRVEAVINEAMERFPGVSNAAQARYYEAVHQELAPLARELERTSAEQSERIAGLTEQHGRDSAELRSLCAARDEARERAKALTAKCALLAASLAQEEKRSEGLEAQHAECAPREAWQPIESAPEGKLLVVSWLDKDDPENPERHAFDFIEDGGWVRHNEDYDHFLCVAPPGSRGPSADAPYTHWMALPDVPAAIAAQKEENNG